MYYTKLHILKLVLEGSHHTFSIYKSDQQVVQVCITMTVLGKHSRMVYCWLLHRFESVILDWLPARAKETPHLPCYFTHILWQGKKRWKEPFTKCVSCSVNKNCLKQNFNSDCRLHFLQLPAPTTNKTMQKYLSYQAIILLFSTDLKNI